MTSCDSPIPGLASTIATRRSEFGKRRRLFDERKVDIKLVEYHRDQGWEPFKTLKTGIKVRRKKLIDELLENRFWCILYWLGYDNLNIGRNFSLPAALDGKAISKQISVLGIDAETVVVAKCRADSKLTRRSLQKDLSEFKSLQKPIANALRRAFGNDFRPKIIWLFVTENIRWSDPDFARAREANIHVLQARQLTYFEEMARKVGRAAKYQFHAEFLSGIKIPALEGRKVTATRTKLGGQTVYLFSARPIDILRIAFINHRDLRDPTGAPTYQRFVTPSRIKKIARFLDDGGYFPNTILLNLKTRPQFDRINSDKSSNMQFGYLTLPNKYKSAWIVDGQHRLLGCTDSVDFENLPNLFFLAFAGLTNEQEAKLFFTINNEQQTVPVKLRAELAGELKWDSDDPKERLSAIASRAVDLLSNQTHGPFEDKIVPPGLKSSNEFPIDLPQFQQAIGAANLIGHVDRRTKDIIPGPCWDRDQSHSLERLVSLLSWYFSIVRDANVDRWEGGKAQKLCHNPAVSGHTRLLGELIRYIEAQDYISPSQLELNQLEDAILPLIQPVLKFIRTTPESEFRRVFTVPFGNSGPREYYFRLVNQVREEFPDWIPTGYEDYVQKVSQDAVRIADDRVKWIQSSVQGFVIETLHRQLGEQFFELVVPKSIQMKAHDKRLDDPAENRMPIESYLDFLDLRKIVENRQVWPLFEVFLSISLPGEKGKAKYLSWMERINEIRRIPAHPHGRSYQPEDIEILEHIGGELESRLPEEFHES